MKRIAVAIPETSVPRPPRRLARPLPILDQLPPTQRRELVRLLTVENLSYVAIADLMLQKYGVKLSGATLSNYFRRLSKPRLAHSSAGPIVDLMIVGGAHVTLFRRSPGIRAWHLSKRGLKLLQAAHLPPK